MKSRLSLTAQFAFLALVCFGIVSCDRLDSGSDRMRRVVLPAGEVHNGWYFAAGDQVIIEGTVNGDVYLAGGVVQVDGTINGDLLVAGGMINISGTVSDDIRAAGGTIHFDGKVGKNVSAAGGTVTVEKSATLDGNLLAACGTIDVSGMVAKEAKIASGDAGISGTIKGSLDFAGDYLSVLRGAKVGGSVRAHVKEKDHVEITEGTVTGAVEISTEEMRHVSRILGYRRGAFWLKIGWAGSLLLTALVFVFLFPRQLKDVGSRITQRPLESLGWGILGLIAGPVSVGILCVTLVGIPMGLLVLTLFIWSLYLSQLSLGLVLGDRFFRTGDKSGWSLFWGLALGILIVQAFTFIPYVRFVVNLASVVFGVGAMIVVLKGEFQQLRTR